MPSAPVARRMNEDRDTCRVCGNALRGVERKRGTCKGCGDGKVRK